MGSYVSIITEEYYYSPNNYYINNSTGFHSCYWENLRPSYNDLGDSEYLEEKFCDSKLNEYWPYCGKSTSFPREIVSWNWNSE